MCMYVCLFVCLYVCFFLYHIMVNKDPQKIVASCWIQRDTCCRDTGNMLPGVNAVLQHYNLVVVTCL